MRIAVWAGVIGWRWQALSSRLGRPNSSSTCPWGCNEGYHNIGIGMEREKPDLGRYVVTTRETDKGALKTPTLRDVASRPPYMHDGSLKILVEVVAFYNRGGVDRLPPGPDRAGRSGGVTAT